MTITGGDRWHSHNRFCRTGQPWTLFRPSTNLRSVPDRPEEDVDHWDEPGDDDHRWRQADPHNRFCRTAQPWVCTGHPRDRGALPISQKRTWITGTSPVMTNTGGDRRHSHSPALSRERKCKRRCYERTMGQAVLASGTNSTLDTRLLFRHARESGHPGQQNWCPRAPGPPLSRGRRGNRIWESSVSFAPLVQALNPAFLGGHAFGLKAHRATIAIQSLA